VCGCRGDRLGFRREQLGYAACWGEGRDREGGTGEESWKIVSEYEAFQTKARCLLEMLL